MEGVENIQYKVVLIDDDIDEAEFLSDAIKESKLPITLVCYKDYYQFLDSIFNSSLPHLLVIDINLPIKNGIEAIKDLKAHQTLSYIPAVTFTNNTYQKFEEESKGAGAVQLIQKPATTHGYKNLVYTFFTMCANPSTCYTHSLNVAC